LRRKNNGATAIPHSEAPRLDVRRWRNALRLLRPTSFGIEVKTEIGRLSPEQKELGSEIISNGGMYVVARSIDDVQAAGL